MFYCVCVVSYTQKRRPAVASQAPMKGVHTMLDTGYGFIGEDGVERVSPEEVWEAEAEDED